MKPCLRTASSSCRLFTSRRSASLRARFSASSFSLSCLSASSACNMGHCCTSQFSFLCHLWFCLFLVSSWPSCHWIGSQLYSYADLIPPLPPPVVDCDYKPNGSMIPLYTCKWLWLARSSENNCLKKYYFTRPIFLTSNTETIYSFI